MKRSLSGMLAWAVLFTAHGAELDCAEPLGVPVKFVTCGEAHIQADIPANQRAALRKRYPRSQIQSGYLNRDKTPYFFVLATESAEDEDQTLKDRMIVLREQSQGIYVILARSSTIEHGGGSMEIRNGSLYLVFHRNSFDNYFQFSYRNRQFLLIGEDRYDYAQGVPGANGFDVLKTSSDYLTGKKIETKNGVVTHISRDRVKPKLMNLNEFGW